jgi:hypothetical protein
LGAGPPTATGNDPGPISAGCNKTRWARRSPRLTDWCGHFGKLAGPRAKCGRPRSVPRWRGSTEGRRAALRAVSSGHREPRPATGVGTNLTGATRARVRPAARDIRHAALLMPRNAWAHKFSGSRSPNHIIDPGRLVTRRGHPGPASHPGDDHQRIISQPGA